MKEQWRFIDHPPRNAYLNMAIDEVLLLTFLEEPILRFYQWEKKAISLGVFQAIEEELNLENCQQQKIQIVRRSTGGGTVFHGDNIDFTYSVIFPVTDRIKDIKDSYKFIHKAIILGLKKLGIAATHADEVKNKKEVNICLVKPTEYDVMVKNKKIAGAAQRRVEGIILHQGYLSLNNDNLQSLLPYDEDSSKEKFENQSIAIADLTKEKISREIFKEKFKESFVEVLDIKLVSSKLTIDEERLAAKLCTDKYGQEAWNFKR